MNTPMSEGPEVAASEPSEPIAPQKNEQENNSMAHSNDDSYPVEPTGPLTVGQIPDDDLDALIRATVPLPAGATTDGWLSLNPEDNAPVRSLLWWQQEVIGGVSVDVDGWQEANGEFTRAISLYGTEQVELSAASARVLAQALTDAAAELDRLDSEAVQ